MIKKHIDGCRFVFNWSLEHKIKTYEESGKSVSQFDLNKKLTLLKTEHTFLCDVNAQSLQGMTRRVESAFTMFFRKKCKFPKFKTKKNPIQSFPVPQTYWVDFDKNIVKLPKIGKVKAKIHRRFTGTLKTANVIVNRFDVYHVVIAVDDGLDVPVKKPYSFDTTVGIDVGLKSFVTLSTGEKTENPKFATSVRNRISVLHRRASHKKKGSHNSIKAWNRLSKYLNHINNKRTDFQHKLSTKIVSENQAIAVETLNIQGMMANHKLARSISDAAWSSFINMLEYKADAAGKTIIKIGQFEPSTRICNACGYHNSDLTLVDRKWECPECHTHHDRDINAAINIKKFALIDQNLIGL
jgi:putative transposase